MTNYTFLIRLAVSVCLAQAISISEQQFRKSNNSNNSTDRHSFVRKYGLLASYRF